jgi:hypothetical protein
MADAISPGQCDAAAVILLFADQNAEQGGLAVTVAADQADSFAGIDFETDGVEKDLTAV